MPNAKRPKLQTLKPRIKELDWAKARGLKTVTSPRPRTLKDKQEANGRTLPLNGKAWRDLRTVVLSEQPLCAECERMGLLVPATDVDHIDNDPSNNERSNLVGLCRSCHSIKTQAHEHYKRTGERMTVKGCDVNGLPLDPAHPWNNEKSPATGGSEPSGPLRINANRKS